MYALFCIVFNLVMLFAYRNLKDAPARGLTLKELAETDASGDGNAMSAYN